jgi:RNA polymerase sigma-70 factor (ECF subfamily)
VIIADPDGDLLRRMAAADETALGALYDRWSPLVHSLALRLLGDRAEAEEVVEETFWQAWRQAARYEESRGAVSTWLITIARSRALDRLRARRRAREEAMAELPELDLDASGAIEERADDPHRSAEQAERRARVAAALATLPPEQRETIVLAYFGGLSQSEIAERTGLPLGTVKTRTRLAMEKLRDQLAALREGATWTRR